jgi:hypothetical protein
MKNVPLLDKESVGEHHKLNGSYWIKGMSSIMEE